MRLSINGRYFRFDEHSLDALNAVLGDVDGVMPLKEQYNREKDHHEYVDDTKGARRIVEERVVTWA